MDEWRLEPARDMGLSGMARFTSPRRESGLFASTMRLGWWLGLRGIFHSWNRLTVIGRENIPAEPPFVLVANHASHLDVLLFTTVLPIRFRDRTFPMAARDVFFESHPVAAFAATFINAFPVSRKTFGGHGLADLRARLLSDACIFALFPEGTRSRTGAMNRFKPGIGMLVAGSPVPVVPCHIQGAFEAMPPKTWLLRPRRLTLRVGPAHIFADQPNERAGWDVCAERLEKAVRGLAEVGHMDRQITV